MCIQDFGRETRGKGSFGRPRRRCEDDIKMYRQEMRKGQAGLIWRQIGTGEGRGCCECGKDLRVPLNSGNFLTG